jgi:DNA-binding MarR family transcriptional regulator
LQDTLGAREKAGRSPLRPAFNHLHRLANVTDRTAAVDAWEALYRAQVAVLRQLRAEFPDGEVTVNEYDVLFNLYRQPQHRARIRDLTPQLLLSQPSVSRLIERLESRGLLDRTPDEGDARGSLVGLTESGVAVFRRVGSQHSAWIAERMSGLTPAELLTLTELTDKVRNG